MKLQEYISSGILEAYILGSLSASEMLEVEAVARTHPEVKKELEALEIDLEALAQKNAIAPPPDLRRKILESLSEHSVASSSQIAISGKKLVFAALLGLGLASTIFYYCTQKQKSLSTDMNKLTAEVAQLQELNREVSRNLDDAYESLSIMLNPEYERVQLDGQAFAPTAKAEVLWHAETGQVYLNALGMSPAPLGFQYQLWSIDENGPASIGVFDVPTQASLIDMQNKNGVQAFAITLEIQGGVQSPTLEKMVALGEVSG